MCVLSVTGTAAIINLLFTSGEIGLLNTALSATKSSATGGDIERNEGDRDTATKKNGNSPPKLTSANSGGKAGIFKHNKSVDSDKLVGGAANKNSTDDVDSIDCSICHIPYSRSSVPFNEHMKKCLVCKYDITQHISIYFK